MGEGNDMKNSTKSIKKFLTIIIFPILILLLLHSISFAQNFENKTCHSLIFFDDINCELLSLSFNDNRLRFQPGINSISLKSFFFQTHINAIYHYGKNEFELGLSNSF